MRTLFIFLLSLLCAAPISAQSDNATVYTIYSTTSILTMQRGKMKVQLVNGMKLSPNEVVNIPERGQLVLVDEATRERFTIDKAGSNSVSSLIAGGKKKLMAITEFNYMKKNLLSHKSQKDPMSGVINVDRRVDADSLFCDSIISVQ